MALVSQCISDCRVPSLRDAMVHGGSAREWESILDGAWAARHAEPVLRVLENQARREDRRRARERKLIYEALQPPTQGTIGAPNVFSRLFRENIGGVAKESDAWFDGDYVAVDEPGGKTQSLIDYMDPTHALSQPLANAQCALPAAVAGLANANALSFLSGQYYDSNRVAARWGFLHKGSGMEMIAAVRIPSPASTQVWFSTGNSGAVASLEGVLLDGTNTLRYGFGATLGNQSAGTFTNGESFYVDISHASPDYALRKKGTSVTAGSFAATSAADPPSTFRIGARVDGTFAATLWLRSLYTFHRILQTAERAVAQAFVFADTGLPA